MAVIECVPNISEGRRLEVVGQIADAIRGVRHVRLLDCSSDRSHNRSVLTLAGDSPALKAAVLAMVEAAVAAIDLGAHSGVHPRIGAVDVVPFVPLRDATTADCVALAKDAGRDVARRFGIPVFLYEEAAANPRRRHLEDIRRGGFEGLAAKMRMPEWAPDYGPASPHPTAGATVMGARGPLIAYNVNLATDRIEVARAVASAVRSSSGGLPSVKAMGVALDDRGIVQVSMNLTDYRQTSMRQAFEAVAAEALRRGVGVLESEIVGLVPDAALPERDVAALKLPETARTQVLETRLPGLG